MNDKLTDIEARDLLRTAGGIAFVAIFILSVLFVLFGAGAPSPMTGETWPIHFVSTTYVAPWLPLLRDALFFVSLVLLIASCWLSPLEDTPEQRALWRLHPTLALVASVLLLILWLTAINLGLVALLGSFRPGSADTLHSVAHAFNGTTHYFSQSEGLVLRAGEPIGFVALLGFILAFFIANWRTLSTGGAPP